MDIELITFLLLFSIQIIFIIIGVLSSINLSKKYRHVLGMMVDVASTIEAYSRVLYPINLTVNDSTIAHSTDVSLNKVLVVNRDKVYNYDMFNNIFAVFSITKMVKLNGFSIVLVFIGKVLFLLEFITFFVLFIFLDFKEYIYISLLVLSLTLIMLNIILIFLFRYISKVTYSNVLSIIELDDVERARSRNLLYELAYRELMYPLFGLKAFLRFLSPF